MTIPSSGAPLSQKQSEIYSNQGSPEKGAGGDSGLAAEFNDYSSGVALQQPQLQGEAAEGMEGYEAQQVGLRYTKLDVFEHELPYKVWSIRNQRLLESRRKPSLKTCLGLGAGFPE